MTSVSRREGLKILSALGIAASMPKILTASPADVSSLIDEITEGNVLRLLIYF